MSNTESAFSDFVDDCFIDQDPICNKNKEESLELVASDLISQLLSESTDDILAA